MPSPFAALVKVFSSLSGTLKGVLGALAAGVLAARLFAPAASGLPPGPTCRLRTAFSWSCAASVAILSHRGAVEDRVRVGVVLAGGDVARCWRAGMAGRGCVCLRAPLLRATLVGVRRACPSARPKAVWQPGRCFGETGVLLWRRPCPHYQRPNSRSQQSTHHTHTCHSSLRPPCPSNTHLPPHLHTRTTPRPPWTRSRR